MRIFKRLLRWALILAFTGLLLAVIAVGVAYWLVAPRLPSVAVLKDYHMQVPLRVLSADGKLIASFGETRRIPVAITQVPDLLKHAVLSAEDADFYHHPGVDWRGIVRAGWHVVATGGDKGPGGSTITQQVARNIFLSPEKLYSRKLTEIFIALRIEHELSKDQILELYLNKMFLGHRSYGVAAAAEYYYGKTLDQLTVAECALIASTFQLPSVVNPLNSPKRALARRNWVLGEMLKHGYITKPVYEQAIAEPNGAYPHEQPIEVDAPYLAEMVRRQVLDRLGNEALTEGYVVKTTLQSSRQQAAVEALRNGLIAYDHRHGWRGPEAHQDLPADASDQDYDNLLSGYTVISGLQPGVVTARVLADPFGRVLLLQVEDTGPGIPESERELVFQPFYRSLGTNVDGSGLGLPIVREIALQHRAAIDIADAHPGQVPPGTRVTVRFDAASADEAQAEAAQAAGL